MAFSPLNALAIYVVSHCMILQISITKAENISVSFNLHDRDLVRLDGDALVVQKKVIQLTQSARGLTGDGSAGRVVYKEKIPLWNDSRKAVANFTTHFQFQINWTKNRTGDYGGDGLAFFMASPESGYYVPYRGDCGWLGLFNSRNNGDSSNKLVAVEFDTYQSVWDKDGNHVGIDVNNITSEAYVSVDERLNDGNIWDAWIDYHGEEQMLKVSVSCKSNGQGPRSLSHRINLAKYLPENVLVGFSAAACKSSEIHRLISWNFTNTIFGSWEKDEIFVPSGKGKNSSKLIISIASCVLVAVILVFFVIHRYTRPKRQRSDDMQRSDGMEEAEHSDMDADMNIVFDHVPRKFTYAELTSSTNNFSEKQKLGRGGFGDVYKGILVKSDEIVAVKRISAGSKQGKKEYLAEITTITRLRHRNLVQLLGWCHEKGQLMLVYEYMPNGSLDHFLFGKRRGELDWTSRYKIASNIASALLYLHELWDECVVHRDVKSSNVMLDSEFNAKLGDFGLARLVKHEQWSQTTTIAGTLGYLAPECARTGISSPESDVFSFGAVVLEISCGRRALDVSLESTKMRLVEWVWDFYGQGRLFDAADSTLMGVFDRAEMEQLMMIGLWCSHPDAFSRPKIRQVLQLLNFEVPMPHLPDVHPKTSYSPFQEGLFSQVSDCAPHTNSQEMAVFSCSLSTDVPSTSTQASSSTNSSILMSKS